MRSLVPSVSVSVSALLLAHSALAAVGVVESTGAFIFPVSGTPTEISAMGVEANPRLDGYDFGSINTITGESLVLSTWYFENYAWNGGSTPTGALTNNNYLSNSSVASLTVTIKSGTTTVSSNTYALEQVGWFNFNRYFQLTSNPAGYDLASGLSNGSYTVEFSNTFSVNQLAGTVSQFNVTTAISTASFSVVPAPGAAALIGLAGLTTSRRRK